MIHLISDYRRIKDQLKIDRYHRYSKIKIIENTEKYMKKVKDSYNELKKDATIFEINEHPDYHKYLKKIYEEMKEKVEEYGLNDEENNLHDNNQPNINNNVKNEDFDTSKNIRKFKKAVRKINKLQKLYQEINKEKEKDSKRFNMNKKCTCGFVILFIAFSIIIITDFLLPITMDSKEDFTESVKPTGDKFDSIGALIIFIILIYPASVFLSSYTLAMIYSTNRKNYISGDYLYDEQINDNINLLKTVQIICGYSFSILYCNIYFWRTVDTHGHYGKPKFYETTFIPDYTLKQGITIFMIAKIIVISSSMIGCYYFSSWGIFKNDLGELDKSDDSKYDQSELDRIYQEKNQVVIILNNHK